MSDLKPINREEAILSGEDLKPLSRKEYFLKKLGKSGGEGWGDSGLPATGIQIVEPLTADNAPTPPEGYTPENYYVNVIVNSDDTVLQNVAITVDDSTPGLIPTFLSQSNLAVSPVNAVKNPYSVYSPIESDPTGTEYKLTIKENILGPISIFTMPMIGQSQSPMSFCVNASNLEWVKATGIK